MLSRLPVPGLFLSSLIAAACATSPAREAVPPDELAPGTESIETFDQALRAFVEVDAQGGFDAKRCRELRQRFEAASKQHARQHDEPLAVALYNAGVVERRCGNAEAARRFFERAAAADPDLGEAVVQAALERYRSTGDVHRTIDALRQRVERSRFQDVRALVALATLQLERNAASPGIGCENDDDCALLNLQRALAIRDDDPAALNQLALVHLVHADRAHATLPERSRETSYQIDSPQLLTSPIEGRILNRQQLDLALLVADQGRQKASGYAPLYNTTGLILFELGNYTGASRMFTHARELDPKLYAAHMNFAALNQSFRGYEQAEQGYRAALAIDPESYEAKLGLALAIRSQLAVTGDSNDARSQSALDLLEQARASAPERPEAYFNLGVLLQDTMAKREDGASVLIAARDRFREFLDRADGNPRFLDATRRGRQRLEDIDAVLRFTMDASTPR